MRMCPEAGQSGFFAAGGKPAVKWIKDDFDGALAQAQASGKPLLANFTGYACTNCKWMKANMFTKPEIEAALADLVLVELYTDGLDAAGEANQQLQISRFNSSTIPFYAVIRPDDTLAGTFSGQTRNAAEFLKFLKSGVVTCRTSGKRPRGRHVWATPRVLQQLRRDPIALHRKMHDRYGDVVRISFGFSCAYMLRRPEHAGHVLRDNHTTTTRKISTIAF